MSDLTNLAPASGAFWAWHPIHGGLRITWAHRDGGFAYLSEEGEQLRIEEGRHEPWQFVAAITPPRTVDSNGVRIEVPRG